MWNHTHVPAPGVEQDNQKVQGHFQLLESLSPEIHEIVSKKGNLNPY